MIGSVTTSWLTPDELSDPDTRQRLVQVVQAVVAAGGAVGWLEPPPEDEVLSWLHGILVGSARVLLVRVDGRVEALGAWSRRPGPVVREMAEVRRVMAHPDARGLGLGRTVVEHLVADAREAGIEVAILACRGNNHRALALYEQVGFREHGRLHDVLAVAEHRFDEVLLSMRLNAPTGTVPHGSSPTGPGGSTRRATRSKDEV